MKAKVLVAMTMLLCLTAPAQAAPAAYPKSCGKLLNYFQCVASLPNASVKFRGASIFNRHMLLSSLKMLQKAGQANDLNNICMSALGNMLTSVQPTAGEHAQMKDVRACLINSRLAVPTNLIIPATKVRSCNVKLALDACNAAAIQQVLLNQGKTPLTAQLIKTSTHSVLGWVKRATTPAARLQVAAKCKTNLHKSALIPQSHQKLGLVPKLRIQCMVQLGLGRRSP